MLGDESAEVRAAAVGALAGSAARRRPSWCGPTSTTPTRASRRPRRWCSRGSAQRGRSRRWPSRRWRASPAASGGPQRLAPRGGDRAAADSAIRAPACCWCRCSTTPTRRSPTKRCAACGERGQADFLFVPALVSLLRDRRLKGSARDVLVGYGEEVVPALGHFLRDPEEDIWVRRHVPVDAGAHPGPEVDGRRWSRRSSARRTASCATSSWPRSIGCTREHPELTFDQKPIEALALTRGQPLLRVPVAALQPVHPRRRHARRACCDDALDEKRRGRASASSSCSGCSIRGATSSPPAGPRARRRARQGVGVRVPRQRPVRRTAPPADADARGHAAPAERVRKRQRAAQDARARRRGNAAAS